MRKWHAFYIIAQIWAAAAYVSTSIDRIVACTVFSLLFVGLALMEKKP